MSGGDLSIPAIDWSAAVCLKGDLIKTDLKTDLATVISQPFSQRTGVQQAVFNAYLMDAVKKYYDFEFVLMCGIPQVTLLDSSDDFQSILRRLNQLKIFFSDFYWWLDPLLSPVQKFKESVQGNLDIA